MAMTLAEMQASSSAYGGAGKRRYPGSKHVCDLAIGATPDWAIEVKLARLGRVHLFKGRDLALISA